MADTVFIRLLDEGTDVWRPIQATNRGGGEYLLLGTAPTDENWEFGPGDLVRCVPRRFADGTEGLVATERA
jgi:hypothetical protein